jgi:fructose-specific PTS system IIA-like component
VDLDALLPWEGTQVQIDGNAGLLVVDPSPAVARYYQQEAWVQAQIRNSSRYGWIKPGRRKTVSASRSRPTSPIR